MRTRIVVGINKACQNCKHVDFDCCDNLICGKNGENIEEEYESKWCEVWSPHLDDGYDFIEELDKPKSLFGITIDKKEK